MKSHSPTGGDLIKKIYIFAGIIILLSIIFFNDVVYWTAIGVRRGANPNTIFNWIITKRNGNIENLEAYLQSVPDSTFNMEAKQLLDSLYWTDALNRHTIETYQKYISSAPLGKYSEFAAYAIDYKMKHSFPIDFRLIKQVAIDNWNNELPFREVIESSFKLVGVKINKTLMPPYDLLILGYAVEDRLSANYQIDATTTIRRQFSADMTFKQSSNQSIKSGARLFGSFGLIFKDITETVIFEGEKLPPEEWYSYSSSRKSERESPLYFAFRETGSFVDTWVSTMGNLYSPAFYITGLKSKNVDIQEASAKSLGRIGSQAISFLMSALNEEYNKTVNEAILESLIKINDPRAIITIAEYGVSDYLRRLEAKKAIRSFGEVAFTPLIKLLETHNDRLWDFALEILGEIGDERAVIPIRELLAKEEDWNLRAKDRIHLMKLAKETIDKILHQDM